MLFKRFIPLFFILAGMGIAYLSGATNYFSAERLNELNRAAQVYVQNHSTWAPLSFVGIYYLYAALALPGAFVLTILGGVIFPFPFGFLYVLIADTCGSCTLFLSAKAAFGPNLPSKAGPFLEKMEKGFQKNPVGYLLLMRFIPIFPFWMINTAPAFFGIGFTTFFWTTVVGLIPENLILTSLASMLMSYFERLAAS